MPRYVTQTKKPQNKLYKKAGRYRRVSACFLYYRSPAGEIRRIAPLTTRRKKVTVTAYGAFIIVRNKTQIMLRINETAVIILRPLFIFMWFRITLTMPAIIITANIHQHIQPLSIEERV